MQPTCALLSYVCPHMIESSLSASESHASCRAKEGVEYDVEQRGEQLYIIRKQDRSKRADGTIEGKQ